MYKNLQVKMRKEGITQTMLANLLSKKQPKISKKMCHYGFSVAEAIKIKQAFFPEDSVEELFAIEGE